MRSNLRLNKYDSPDVACFQLRLGRLVFRVALPPQVEIDLLLPLYEGYESDEEPEWRIDLQFDPSLTDEIPLAISHDGPVTSFQMLSHRGQIDLARRQAVVTTPTPERAHQALARVISFVCTQELPRRGEGLFLHGAGIVIGGEGHAFFGASGRGKSTVSMLAEGVGEVLCDENVIVLLGPEGPTLLSTPFWGFGTPEHRIRRVGRREVPLRALYSLHHSPNFDCRPLSPAAAVMELLSSEKVAIERPDYASDWLAMAERVARAVPLYHLGFRPTRELWDVLSLDSV